METKTNVKNDDTQSRSTAGFGLPDRLRQWIPDGDGHNSEYANILADAADRLEVLELEHAEFFERWHDERRRREKLAHDVERCHRMLLSEPDTKGALFKAENILRDALAEQKVGAGDTALERPNKLCEQRLTDDKESAACGQSARHEC